MNSVPQLNHPVLGPKQPKYATPADCEKLFRGFPWACILTIVMRTAAVALFSWYHVKKLFRSVPWAYILAFAFGSAAVALFAWYHLKTVHGNGAPYLEGLGAGVFILVCAGLLREFQLARVLQKKVLRQQVILKFREYAEQVADTVPAGLLMLSPDLRVLFVNQSFLDAFHLQSRDVLGWRIHDVIEAEGVPRQAEELLEGGAAAPPIVTDVTAVGRKEKRLSRITLTPIPNEEGEKRLLLVLEDLTEGALLRLPA